jgi:hypothetical protein
MPPLAKDYNNKPLVLTFQQGSVNLQETFLFFLTFLFLVFMNEPVLQLF